MEYREIQYNGRKNKEPPKDTLDKLFSYNSPWKAKNTAYLLINYKDEHGRNVSGMQLVDKDKLAKYDYTVSRSDCSPYDIIIKLNFTRTVRFEKPDLQGKLL